MSCIEVLTKRIEKEWFMLFFFFWVGVGQVWQVGCNCGGQLTIIGGKCDPNQGLFGTLSIRRCKRVNLK